MFLNTHSFDWLNVYPPPGFACAAYTVVNRYVRHAFAPVAAVSHSVRH
jgi:hypothetical protein